ncbi:DUF1796 family putative cysteine peptidase [Paenibacillus motobuensis]|uniref:Uncharacterized protein n=1 Tax=Paenibacillus motobuensis TaxID=295324 RepID=A0ABP3ICJ7_9BACL
MLLHDMKGRYQAVFSLGENCLPAIQLERNGLRLYSGPLDWLAISQISERLASAYCSFIPEVHLMKF